MAFQSKIVTVLLIALSIGLVCGLVANANDDAQYKTFESKEFGFSISYPQNWEEAVYPKEADRPQIYENTLLRINSPEAPSGVVTVNVNELAEPVSLDEFKQYVKLQNKLFPQGRLRAHLRLGDFAGSRAVIVQYNRTSFYEERITDKSGTVTKWEKSTWKGRMYGAIRNGYLYKITVGATQEDYDKANRKYLSKILDSFEFKKIKQQ